MADVSFETLSLKESGRQSARIKELVVAAGLNLPKPESVRAYYLANDKSLSEPFSCETFPEDENVLVVLGERARASVIFDEQRSRAAYFVLAESAQLNLAVISGTNNSVRDSTSFFINQLGHSEVHCLNFLLAGDEISNQWQIVTKGSETSSKLHGLLFGDKSQKYSVHATVEHCEPRGISEQYYKTLLFDESQADILGKIIIRAKAQKSQAWLMNNNLLLGDQARVSTRPELEIEADDVKANHGATLGRLDDEQLFYFQSRGIDKQEAVKQLSTGFALDLIYKFPDVAVQKIVRPLVEEQLARLSMEWEKDI